MEGAFRFDQRWSVCLSCGAATQVPPQGGAAQCPSCGAALAVPPRRQDRLQLSTPGTSPEVRAQRLGAQDNQPFPVPEELKPYLEGGAIAEWRLQEALAVWRSSAAQVAQTQDLAVSERLFVLTLLLSGMASPLDDLMKRALLESSLDILALPRHQQFLLSLLGGASAKRRDVQSAEAWLGRCDPEAQDLQADTAWRVSRSLLETARGSWQGVMDLLEPGGRPWPIQDAFDAQAVLLRANAREQQGDLAGAQVVLATYLAEHGSGGRELLRRAMKARRELRLCPRSFESAEQAAAQTAARQSSATSRMIGGVLILSGLFSVGMGVFLYAIMPAEAREGGMVGIVISGLVGLGLLVAGLGTRAKAKAQQRLLLHGKAARARITEVQRTGTMINNVPVYRLILEVHLEGRPPYAASVKKLLDPASAAQLAPGTEVRVKVDPAQPSRVALDA